MMDEEMGVGEGLLGDWQQVILKRSRTDELGNHRLVEPGMAVVHQCFEVSRRLRQMLRHDHISKAEARPDRFRKRAEIDDAIVAVERLEREERRGSISEVAIVIVLEN